MKKKTKIIIWTVSVAIVIIALGTLIFFQQTGLSSTNTKLYQAIPSTASISGFQIKISQISGKPQSFDITEQVGCKAKESDWGSEVKKDEYGCSIWSCTSTTTRNYWICKEDGYFNTGAGAVWSGNCKCSDWRTIQSSSGYKTGSTCWSPNGCISGNCWIGAYADTIPVTSTCGGMQFKVTGKTPTGCGYKLEVYKDNKLIYQPNEGKGWSGTGTRFYFYDDMVSMVKPENYLFSWYVGGQITDASGNCKIGENFEGEIILPVPEMKLNMTYDDTAYSDQVANIKLHIEQDVGDYSGKLNIVYSLDTAVGMVEDEKTQDIEIKKGTNIYEVEIPTSKVTDVVSIKTSIDVFMPTASLSGFKTTCGISGRHVESVANCPDNKIKIGVINFDQVDISILPKPLYTKPPCGGGYSLSESNLCIRDDIKDLTCTITGCPVLNISGEEVTYSCSSAGICVQTIFEQKSCKIINDTDTCPDGYSCEESSGLCIKTEIFEVIVQCSTANDCVTPCDGKTIECKNNQCIYDGECIVKEITCRDVGCASGTCNEETGICEKESIITKIPVWLWITIGVIAFAGLVFAVLYFTKKRR